MQICRSVFQTLISAVGLLAVLFAAFKLLAFLSHVPFNLSRANRLNPLPWSAGHKEGEEEVIEALSSGIVNVFLLSTFTLQHSVMANPAVKQFISQSGLGVAERSLYIIATSASLLLIFYNWHLIPWYLWQFDSTLIHYMCFLVHCLSWIGIYGGCIQRDLPEMIGIKQVYYYLRGLPDPMSLKTGSLCRFYYHMRHPSFIGFAVLFWFNPYMSADRLLLAVILTLYMLCAWNVDHQDYQYHKNQVQEKKFELSR